LALTADLANGEGIMDTVARFPEPRGTRRLGEAGSGRKGSFGRDSQRKNLTFSFGRWKLEVGRADYTDPEFVKTEVNSSTHNKPCRMSNPAAPDNLPEPRSSPQSIRRSDHAATFIRERIRREGHIDPASPSFWEALGLPEQETLKSVAFCQTFAVGERIMQEGSLADFVIVILEGRVIISVDENGWERIVAERGPGELVGERGGLQVRIRSASVIATERVRGLVVTTESFSTFLTAHPRVLDIVEGQLYNRLTQDQPGHPDYRPGPPAPLRGQNCTVLLTDIVGFSSPARTDEDCRVIRNALHAMTNMMLRDIAETWSESRGDGMLIIAWPSIPTATIIDRLLTELLPALEHHNSTHSGPVCFQLRAAISVGPLVSDAMGPSGEAITTIARLIEAPAFKQAMDTSGASLGLIATTFVYETVIKHDRSLTGYRQVQVDVKTFNGSAWMSVFTTPISPHADIDPAVA
jgi:class 3 adenylate cyclase